MSRSPRLAVVALSTVLALSLSPLLAFAQDASPGATEPAASSSPAVSPASSAMPEPAAETVLRPLATFGESVSREQICARSGGSFDGATCALPTEPLTDAALVKAFGSDIEVSVVEAAGPPVSLSEVPPEIGPVVTKLSFVPTIELDRGSTKWLNQKQKQKKDTSIVTSNQTDWNKLDEVGLVSLQLAEPINARGLSGDGGVVVARVRDASRIFDVGFDDRKPVFRTANGRDRDGLAIIEDDRVDIIVPGGIDGPFEVEFVLITGDGLATGQAIGGPAGTDALVPLEPFAPVLACGSAVADVDPADTLDGESFGLGGMTYTFETPLIPEGIGETQPTFNLTLAASGARADGDLPDLELEITPAPSTVRRVITLPIDLSEEGFAGDSGYQLGQIPFQVASLRATLEPQGMAVDFDAAAARALLEEAGWVDTDGDGVLERDLGEVANELNRLTGGGFTESPIAWGWTGCGKDAHWASVQDACSQPLSDELRSAIGTLTGEDPAALFAQPGSFAEGFTGCTLFGESEIFAATWLLEDAYGQPAYDATVLAPFVEQLGCEVADEAPLDGLQLVGTCAEPAFEIFWDDSDGFGSYLAIGGDGIDTALLAEEVVAPIKNGDVDADGISDRFDDDVDGDGLPNDVDDDDDDDLVRDVQDWSPIDPGDYAAPSVFASLLQSLEAN